MGIADEKYVALTTFRKDGERKTTPVWIAALEGGKLGFTTSKSSWKAKRLRNDPRVELQPSDVRGNPREGSDVVTGTGELVHGERYEAVRQRIKDKYGFQTTFIGALAKVRTLFGKGPTTDSAVIVTVDE